MCSEAISDLILPQIKLLLFNGCNVVFVNIKLNELCMKGKLTSELLTPNLCSTSCFNSYQSIHAMKEWRKYNNLMFKFFICRNQRMEKPVVAHRMEVVHQME